MNYKIVTIAPLDKQLKRLLNKYSSLKTEIRELTISLQFDPFKGTSIGNDCYKYDWQ